MASNNIDHVTELIPAYLGGSLDRSAVEAVGTHLAVCPGCQSDLLEWKAVATASQALGNASPAPSRGLLDRVFEKIEESERGPSWHERWIPIWLKRPAIARSLAGGLAMAVLALLLVLTPIGSYAQRVLDVFQPHQFAVVPITVADVKALHALNQYGEVSGGPSGEIKHASSAADASTQSGISILTPSTLPASVTTVPFYNIIPSISATFTFSAAKAGATIRSKGNELPPLPSNIDGSSINITTGAGVITQYGGDPSVIGGNARTTDAVPQLIIGQAYAPTATSTGASPKELEDYLLSLPGISDDLKNAIRTIGDPTITWPIPVPVGEVNTHSATVQGVSGTVFSEKSGFATGVLWLKNGLIYGVAGPLNETGVLTVANSLH